jgi:C-terminal processing protease CtpA/Prc
MRNIAISMNAPRRLLIALALAGLSACGGGGGGGGSSSGGNGGGGSNGWIAGVFQPSSSFAAQCAAPRTGSDPGTGMRYPDVQGSTLAENNWLRSWTNELYLWYREVRDQNPALFATPDYFDSLKTFATTSSGHPKDKFHFTYATAEWQALSESGMQAGYGAQWAIIAETPPRLILVAYTEPNAPATTAPANLARGAQVLVIDGVDVVNATGNVNIDTMNAGLFPSAAGETHAFSILDPGATTPRTVTMVSANLPSAPVQNVATMTTASGTVGYMLFNDHLATAEAALITAVNTLRAAGINDLVLDIRYNGGGFLDIASEAAYMIAGPGPTAGRTFEQVQFNDKHPFTDPVTGNPLTPIPFYRTAGGYGSVPAGQALPTLNLSRVYVLTGPDTCSASESIINSLRGVNVEVIQVGSTTCGKPYGFYPRDNCGTTYFSIEFRGVNAMGFGDYTDGFSPANASGAIGVPVPGCAVADDFTHGLGDPAEALLATALSYRTNSICPGPPTGIARSKRMDALSGTGGMLHKSPWLQNRIFRR